MWQQSPPFTYSNPQSRIEFAHHTSCGHAASIPTSCSRYLLSSLRFGHVGEVVSSTTRLQVSSARAGAAQQPPCLCSTTAPIVGGQGTIESRALPLVDTAKHARDVVVLVVVCESVVGRFVLQRVPWTSHTGCSVKMSLNTLIEAAKFLEMQEQKEQQQHHQVAGPSKTSPPVHHKLSTVLITSPNLLTLTQETAKKAAAPQAEQQQVVSSSSTVTAAPPPQPPRRILHNSFDIMNPLVIDETNAEVKRKQPPLVFRAGTREVHNKLEKHRRAHLKECFDVLKKQLPQTQDEKKTSNLSILHSALRCIQSLKRKERELEHEMERLARDKIAAQQKLAVLKKDISSHYDNVDFSKILPEVVPVTTDEVVKLETVSSTSQNGAGGERIQIPLLTNKTQISIATTQVGTIKEVSQQPVQTTALSVLPVGYSVPQGLVLQKLIVPKGITELTPLVSTHFITQQQINGKVVPLVNAQYVVKPVVVVSRPS